MPRTAAGSGLATKLMSRADSQVAAIIGAGPQGRAHIQAMLAVRPLQEIRIASRDITAAQRLADAAQVLSTQPMTLQLRYLQTLTEIGVEKNTTIVFPLPIELMSSLNKILEAHAETSRQANQ